MKSFLLIKISFLSVFILLVSCQTKEVNPFEEARNPYAQLGVEGYMGAVMTSCLGIAPSGPPIQKKSSKGTIFYEGGPSAEQTNYFDCVDAEILKKENQANKDSD